MSITAYKIESVGHDRTGKDYGYVNIMYRYGNKRSCHQPDQCEQMEVMWASAKRLLRRLWRSWSMPLLPHCGPNWSRASVWAAVL